MAPSRKVAGATGRVRFQQEPAAVGMAGVVKDADLVEVPGEDVDDLFERSVVENLEPAKAIPR
jgi:hypothetical protein